MSGRHAYCFVANSNFRVLETALRMIDHRENDIYILFDKKARIPVEYMDHVKRILVHSEVTICEQLVNWGGYSQVSAVLKLLSLCVEKNREYMYIHFMQGSDIPIRSQEEIHRFFAKNYGKEFVEVDLARMQMAKEKCIFRHLFCHNRYFRRNILMKCLNFGFVWLQRILGVRKNTDIVLYHGSALFSITEKCAKYVLSRKDEIYHRFRFALAPDEVFLQTILMDSEFNQSVIFAGHSVSCNARLIDRSRPDGKNSPHIWRYEERFDVLGQPEEKCFARKFDEQVDFSVVEYICEFIKRK